MIRSLAVTSCLLLPSVAVAQSAEFLRVDQTGGFAGGEAAFTYGVDVSRQITNIDGTGTRNAYHGVMHRLSAGYGVADWLTVACDQSLRQDATGEFSVGVIVPELRLGLMHGGPEWLRQSGISVYAQGRARLKARRPSSVVSGLVLERRLHPIELAARLGYETTVSGEVRENGFRYELGLAWPFLLHWQLAGEAWGHVTWREVSQEQEHHVGPTLQFEASPFRFGLQAALGVAAHRTSSVDGVGMARVAVSF